MTEPSHYFDETPTTPEHRRTVTATLWGRELELSTANGVFAGDGLDRGTAVLLRASTPPPGSPRVLDLGCNNGYGSFELSRHGHRVVGVDVSAEALDDARRRFSA